MAKTVTKTKKAKVAAKTARAKARVVVQSKPTDAAQAILDAHRRPGYERRHSHPMRAKNGYMHILLTNTVAHLGGAGELVKVRPGYARNYLIPMGLATFATAHNLRIVEKHRERLKALEQAKRADLVSLAAQIAQRSIFISANANPEGHLYGSVNAAQIAAALKSDGLQIEEEHVRIEGPLKELGQYVIPLNLGMDVTGEIKLWVVPTHEEEAAPGA